MQKITYDKPSGEFHKGLNFIYFAIAIQLITSMNFYCINNYLKLSSLETKFMFSNHLKAPYWVIVCFLGRISGTYILEKYAQIAGFFNTIGELIYLKIKAIFSSSKTVILIVVGR